VKFVETEKNGKRYNLQHQKKDECRIPSDEEKYITHVQDDLIFDIPIPRRALPRMDIGF
jgi:hypothetical protein